MLCCSFEMKGFVDRIRIRDRRKIHCTRPAVAVPVEPAPTAFSAWPMSGSQGHGFVEKEQLGIAIWLHDNATPVPVGKGADQPSPMLAGSDHCARFVVEYSTIAEEGAPMRGCDQVASWGDSVLSGHLSTSSRSP